MPDWFEGGNGIYRVAFVAQHDVSGDTQVNTLHYQSRDATLDADDNDPQSLADVLGDAPWDKFALFYSDDWTIQPVEVVMERDPLAPDAPRSAWSGGTASFGDLVGTEDLPRACCAVATLRSDAIGRRSTGRLFLGGSTGEGEQANGVWGATPLARWQAFLDAIPHEPDVAPVGSDARMSWCVYSRTARAAGSPNYAFDIQSTQLRTSVHWLRSRATG